MKAKTIVQYMTEVQGYRLAEELGDDPYEPGWYFWLRVAGSIATPPQGPYLTEEVAWIYAKRED